MSSFLRSLRISCRQSRAPKTSLPAQVAKSRSFIGSKVSAFRPLSNLLVARRTVFSSAEGNDDPHALFKEQMDQLKKEREEFYGFTDEEQTAWGKAGSDRLPASLMESVEQARAEAADVLEENDDPANDNDKSTTDQENNKNCELYQPSHGLTHLSEDGSAVNMVDVGHKTATKRVARAETKMILPSEVLEAFQGASKEELVGPKGPIFAAAKIAGIMAAKKTSDLIPLCHPLPLDKVQIDIRLEKNVVQINCECRVTHKTGVEMEALTGASVAALTIYDMLKALSHNIRIEQTVLVTKSGGKRTLG